MAHLKLLERSAVFAWSPSSYLSSYIAAGTNAQQVDSSFSTTSAIDLCRLDFSGDDAFYPNLRPTASGVAEFRFHQLVWAEFGGKLGTLIGGCENGAIVLYDPWSKLENPNDQTTKSWCIKQSRKHTGAVRALDLNPSQKQLLASGASNGDVFIFDLNHVEQPMTPGPRPSTESQQQTVVSVGWNGRVEHILATLFPSYAYVWDLRRSDGPIMKLGDLGGGRGQWTTLKWHPDSSTTLCLASGDDHSPVVQMWDVRFANAACAQLEGHQRGILSMDWCTKDADLLITCGKDSKVYIWNPNTNQYLTEIPLTIGGGAAGMVHSWPFQVQWSKRDPNLIGVASFDGRIAVYSLSGAVAGSSDFGATGMNLTPAITPKLADSFPGADFAYQPAAVQKMFQDRQQLQNQQHQQNYQPRVILPNPPKWMRGGCGARFAFGGKLIHFSKPPINVENPTAISVYDVEISQVITEPNVFEKATELYNALIGDGTNISLPSIAQLCQRRAEQASNTMDKCIWECLQAHVQRAYRERYIEIIGGSTDVTALAERVKNICGISLSKTEDKEDLVNGSYDSNTKDDTIGSDELQDEEVEEETDSDTPSPWPLPTSPDELGQLELPSNGQSRDGLLCQLISARKYSAAVELCIVEDKWLDAMQLSLLGERSLYDKTQRRYYERLKDPISKFICLVANERWDLFIASVSLRNPESWRQIFTILLNHVQPNDLPGYLEQLGQRMESESVQNNNNNGRLLAPTCYVAAGLVERLVENLSTKEDNSPLTATQLHDVVEKATILRVSLGGGSQRALGVGPKLADRLGQYANLLVEQGCLTLALQLLDALPEEIDQHLMELRHRVYSSFGGYAPSNIRRPKVPFSDPNRKISLQQQHSHQNQYHQPALRSRAGSYALPPPTTTMQQQQNYGISTGGIPAQSYNQPPPPPTSTTGTQQQQQITAMKPRNRYPSYSSDGISYPTSSVVASSAYSAVSPGAYSGQQQQYPNYATSAPIYQQQQPPLPPPPPPIVQQPNYSNSSSSSSMGYHRSSAVLAIPQPTLPPPPPGPAVELNHRPWNDPPPLSPKKKTVAPKKPDVPPPVTFPVLGGAGGIDQQMSAQYHQQQPPISTFSSQQQYGNYSTQQQPPMQLSPAPKQPTPAPVAAVIPPEHEKILTILNRLGELTAVQAPNVQVRRRIEDGLQKLNTSMPSLLENNRLSKTTLTELHQLVDYIRAYDYNSALSLYSHIVEGSDFSTIASFMPSVKVIIQSAAQMGVYYS